MTMKLTKTHPLDNGPIKMEGLVDKGKILVRCSACNRGLYYIWKTRPDEDTNTVFARCKCPWCADYSFEVKLEHIGYHIGHSDECTIDTIDIDDNDKIKVTVIKGGVKDE